jgi:hypothetical protein
MPTKNETFASALPIYDHTKKLKIFTYHPRLYATKVMSYSFTILSINPFIL